MGREGQGPAVSIDNKDKSAFDGGRGEIRTHGIIADTPVFKTGALNRSATLPILVLWCRRRAPFEANTANLQPKTQV